MNLPNAISTMAYNANNQLTQWGTATPTYDANGNTLSDGTNTYVWNARNQLASMNVNGESFQHDPFGRRTGKTILGTTTNYLYDGSNPVQELSGTMPTANLLTGGVDEYFTRTDSTGTANFLMDALVSTIRLTNSAGGTLAQYTYEPFGNTTTTGSSTNSYQYTGRENDSTGVYFYRARYYSPSLQRFISEDPIEFEGGSADVYEYAASNPVSLRDETGKNPACLVGGLIGTIVYNSYVIYRSTAGRYSAYYAGWDGLGRILAGNGEAFAAGCALNWAAETIPELFQPNIEPSPLPPGWNEGWEQMPATRANEPWNWWDPQGGEWNFQDADPYHDPHWNYNPWDNWNSPWQNVPIP